MSVHSRLTASYITGQRKYSIDREFQSLAVQGKELLKDIRVTSRDGDRKIMQSIRMASRPP